MLACFIDLFWLNEWLAQGFAVKKYLISSVEMGEVKTECIFLLT